MQRRRIGVALADFNEFDQRVHSCNRVLPRAGSSTPATDEIENAEPARVVSPHLREIKPSLTRELDDAFLRIFVRIFRGDSLAGAKIKLAILNADGLVDLTDEINLDPALG